MSDYLSIFKKKKDVEPEDEEAYEEQMRAFQLAQEILRKQRMDQEQKQNQEDSKRAGITIVSPNIDISQLSQEELDKLLKRKHEMLLAKAPITEEELEGTKIKQKKQAYSSLFYTVEALENIRKFNDAVIIKEQQLADALRTILQSDSKIKCIDSKAIDVLFNETKKIFDQNAQLVDKISLIEREKYRIQEQMKDYEQQNHTLILENKALKQELEYEK